MLPLNQAPLSGYAGSTKSRGEALSPSGEKPGLPAEESKETLDFSEAADTLVNNAESSSASALQEYRNLLTPMVKGNRAAEALQVIAEDLLPTMDIDTLRALRDFGVTIYIPDTVPKDMKEGKTAGTYDAPDKKVTIPFEYLVDRKERPVLVVHEMGHAFDHLTGQLEPGSIDPITGAPVKKGYKTYHSTNDEKMRVSYEQYVRRVDSLKVAGEAFRQLQAGTGIEGGREGISLQGLYTARYRTEVLGDGRVKVDIRWITQPQVEGGKKKLKRFGLTALAGAAGCLLTGPGSLLFLGFAGIAGIGAILSLKTLFGRDMTFVYGKHTDIFTRELPGEAITLKGKRKVEFVHGKERDSVILPAKFYPRKDLKFVQWSPYAHDTGDVAEYFAESVSHGTCNLEQRDPGAWEIFKGGFHPTLGR